MNKNLNILNIKDWGLPNANKPLIISGPCSAETEKQVLETAQQLKNIGITIFRAGIWKPRTRPGSFEGVGDKGLEWLKKVKEETGMLVTTEVANIKHINKALNAGIDILWIGARTTTNPFAIQEIADALKGIDIPVLIKNPVNPDVDLWVGAIERINKAGIKRIGAVHRGFSSYDNSIYRNIPQWQICIDLQREIPELLMINDPSHISGKPELIYPISQKAMDLNFDGLMIESHINPSKALSDAKQQITPNTLKELINSIIIRDVSPNNASIDSLENLRHQIDNVDDDLLDLLKQRMDISANIGQYKKENNMTILQHNRWNEILQRNISKGLENNLNEDFVSKIYKVIHQESINKQTSIMNK